MLAHTSSTHRVIILMLSAPGAAAGPDIPQSWTETDRKNYVKLGKRRMIEQAQLYAIVAMGCQLFKGAVEMRECEEESQKT